MAYKSGPYTPQSGAFVGESFPSYRQYLNAKEYLKATGELTTEPGLIRGVFSRGTAERRRERLQAVEHIVPAIRRDNYEYLLQRATEQQAGRELLRDPFRRPPNLDAIKARMRASGSEFNKLYRAAEREGFAPREGGALGALLYYAGLRSGVGGTAEERQRYITMVQWYLEHESLAELSAESFKASSAA